MLPTSHGIIQETRINQDVVLRAPGTTFHGSAFFSNAMILLSTISDSGNSSTFGVVSGPGSIISGNTLTFTGPGNVTVEANVEGDNKYRPGYTTGIAYVAPWPPTITSHPSYISNNISITVESNGYFVYPVTCYVGNMQIHPSSISIVDTTKITVQLPDLSSLPSGATTVTVLAMGGYDSFTAFKVG